MTTPSLTIGDKATMLSDLTQDNATSRGILGDVCGANYAIKGSAWGYGLTKSKLAWNDVSNSGVFTNKAGDSITVVFDHSKYFNIITDQVQPNYDGSLLYAKLDGRDSIEKIATVMSKMKAHSFIEWNVDTHGSGWAENAAAELKSRIPQILSYVDQIHAQKGKRVNVLVVLHRDEPFSFKNFALEYIQLAAIAASFIPGIPKDIVSKAANTLTQWLKSGVVDVTAIMDCALVLAPDSLRKNEYVTKGANIYTALSNHNYTAAAQQVGIDVPAMLTDFQKTCDWTNISKTAKIGFDGAISSLQNMLSADAVNKLAGGLRSGQLVMDTIAGQSITTVKQFQDIVLGGINPQTAMTMIPQPYQIAKTLLNETTDITNSDEFRAIVGLGNGIAVGDNVLDGLSIKAIAARVEDTLAARYASGVKDLQYSLTTSIDPDKREYFASEVAKLTGAQMLTNPSGIQIPSNIKKAAPYIAIGAAAVGALYFYHKK